jgi:hypothetical protein
VQSNPSFEPTAPGVPRSAAQVKRWAPSSRGVGKVTGGHLEVGSRGGFSAHAWS